MRVSDFGDNVVYFSKNCQQNGDVPKSPFPNRQLLPSVGNQASTKKAGIGLASGISTAREER
jgi:hypothetical protein